MTEISYDPRGPQGEVSPDVQLQAMQREYERGYADGIEWAITHGQPQSPMGSAFQQIADDEGSCDLLALWQAIIDNTKGNGFWLGEILLNEIEKETGFNGFAHSRPNRECE